MLFLCGYQVEYGEFLAWELVCFLSSADKNTEEQEETNETIF